MSAPSPESFTFEPLFLVLALLLLAGYVRLARRHPVSRARAAVFAAGAFALAAPLNSPLETIAQHELLLAHLIQNAITADIAPVLLVLGLSPAMRQELARRGGRPLALLTASAVALPLWLVAWYATHIPAFYDYALRQTWPLELEHAVLVAAGAVFWWSALAGAPQRRSPSGSIAFLLLAFLLAGPLGFALIFSQRPFYDFYVAAPRTWSISPLADQQLGGIFMNAEQGIVFLVAIGYFLRRLFLEEETARDAELGDEQAGVLTVGEQRGAAP